MGFNFKSSLRPAGYGLQSCGNSCIGTWFGWTNPVHFPGRLGVVESRFFDSIFGGGIEIGLTWANIIAGTPPSDGPQFSFNGGYYRDKYVSGSLNTGKWRIFAVWTPQTSTYVGPGYDPSLTSLLLQGALSLVDRDENLISPIILNKTNPGLDGGVSFIDHIDGSPHFGGLDGCGHFYDQVGIRLDSVMFSDITILPNQHGAYLKAIASPNAQQVADAYGPIKMPDSIPVTNDTTYHNVSSIGTSTGYMVGGFFLSDCFCGGSFKSSKAVFGF